MFWILIAVAVILFVVSLLYFFKADAVVKLNEWGKRVLFRDEWTVAYRAGIGFFFLAVSALLFIAALLKFQ